MCTDHLRIFCCYNFCQISFLHILSGGCKRLFIMVTGVIVPVGVSVRRLSSLHSQRKEPQKSQYYSTHTKDCGKHVHSRKVGATSDMITYHTFRRFNVGKIALADMLLCDVILGHIHHVILSWRTYICVESSEWLSWNNEQQYTKSALTVCYRGEQQKRR